MVNIGVTDADDLPAAFSHYLYKVLIDVDTPQVRIIKRPALYYKGVVRGALRIQMNRRFGYKIRYFVIMINQPNMHPAPKRQEYSSGVLPFPHVQASLFMKVYHNPPKSRLVLVFYRAIRLRIF